MIKLFLTDVDGTLTDGGRILDADGKESKRFYIPDGTALVTLRSLGIQTGIFTAEKGPVIQLRARQLKMDHVVIDCHNKLTELGRLCEQLKITPKEVAFIGDDLNDYSILSAVGERACPADAQDIIKKIPGIRVMKRAGGYGAVREFINDLVGEETLLKTWISEHP